MLNLNGYMDVYVKDGTKNTEYERAYFDFVSVSKGESTKGICIGKSNSVGLREANDSLISFGTNFKIIQNQSDVRMMQRKWV